jgi:Predicted oxidoreductases (related to aryl-alcohol dehydrogenases)
MIYKNIPETDLITSALCMGGGMVSVENDQGYCYDLLDRFIDAGGNFIDTANVYGKWFPKGLNSSELNIGAWMKERGNRHRLIIGTKGGHPLLNTMQVSRLSREEVNSDLEESLKALQTDYIDIYWLHRDDENLPVSYILGYLNDFAADGRIRYFGCSNWRAERIREAALIAKREGIRGFVGNQMMWSLATPNKDAITDKTLVCMDDTGKRLHLDTGLTAIPYSSQAGGFYSKLGQRETDHLNEQSARLYLNDENMERYRKIIQLTRELSKTVTEIVLGYLISQPFTTIPIVGPHTPEQLEDTMRAGDCILDEKTVRFLEAEVKQS